jgi:hypothetical protein
MEAIMVSVEKKPQNFKKLWNSPFDSLIFLFQGDGRLLKITVNDLF